MSVNELAPMDGSEPPVGMDNAPALKKQKDDFGTLPVSEEDAKAALERELSIKPTYRNVCHACKTVHPVDGDPICLCNKCGHLCRIVWCGQCVCCAYARFSDRFGPGVADILYPQYAVWLQKKAAEQAKENKLPWEEI